MAMMMEPAPEPKTLELGGITLKLPGSIRDRNADYRVDQYRGLLNDALAQSDFNFSFESGDVAVFIESLTVKLQSIEDGSIVAKFKIIGSFTLGVYGAIAAYPSFKEGVPELANDFKKIVEYVVDQVPQERRPDNEYADFTIYFRDENEIMHDIENSRLTK